MANEIKNVWMTTFEAKPFAKVGGLGEVPPNLSRGLVSLGVKATIIMPTHGTVEGRPQLELEGYGPVYIREWKGVKFLLVGGGPLSRPGVYDPASLKEKIYAFSKCVEQLLLKREKLGLEAPDIVHFHDWHSVFALLRAKIVREAENLPVKFVYHIHLLTREKISLSDVAQAGLDPEREHVISYRGKKLKVTIREAVEMSKGLAERLGALEADKFVTVSRTYLREDKDGVLNSLGWDLENKGSYVYNGTDWRYESSLKEVLEKHGEKVKEFLGKDKFERNDLRRYFLLKALGEMPKGEPRVLDEKLKNNLEQLYAPPYLPDGRVESFSDDGPLAIMTGRIAAQKGINILLEAIPLVLRKIGNAKFVLLLLPVWGSEKYLEHLVETVRTYPENVRVIFGIAPSIFKLAHVSADVFVAPSLWEPFGIMALEGMVTGNPVVASKVGGLKEIVLDVRKHGASGTGLHVTPGDPIELAQAISDLMLVMEASRTGSTMIAAKIEDAELANLLFTNPKLGSELRKSAIKRGEQEFTWTKAAEMALDVYRSICNWL